MMKKDRNSFFSQYGYSAFNAPNIGMPNNTNFNGFTPDISNSELESRVSKLEREIQRLEYRINNLESQYPAGNTPQTSISSTDYNFNNSMYMV